MGYGVRLNCPTLLTGVPTMTLGAARYMLTTGASMANYMTVVPDSTIPVALFWSARLRSLWVQLDINLLMSGKVEGGDGVSRVGL